METEKKQWAKPELIVLVRSKPEEAVPMTCKDGTRLLSGPILANVGCYNNDICVTAVCAVPTPS
jgi:hypothetical protein